MQKQITGSADFRIDFRFEIDHFAESVFQVGEEAYSCRCTDHRDGMALLAKQVAWMLDSPRSRTVVEWEMDGQTWWALDRDGDRLNLNMVELSETQHTLPGKTYVTIFQFSRDGFMLK